MKTADSTSKITCSDFEEAKIGQRQETDETLTARL